MTGLPQLLIIAVIVCTLSRQLSSIESEGGSWAAPTAEELWLVDGFYGYRESILFKHVVSGRLTMLQWMAAHPEIYEQYKLDQ